jgi:hypothetical protein
MSDSRDCLTAALADRQRIEQKRRQEGMGGRALGRYADIVGLRGWQCRRPVAPRNA